MNRTQSIRYEVLLQLYASRPLALSAATMAKRARKDGEDFSEIEIRTEAAYLSGKGFAMGMYDASTNEHRYQITSAGIDERERTAI